MRTFEAALAATLTAGTLVSSAEASDDPNRLCNALKAKGAPIVREGKHVNVTEGGAAVENFKTTERQVSVPFDKTGSSLVVQCTYGKPATGPEKVLELALEIAIKPESVDSVRHCTRTNLLGEKAPYARFVDMSAYAGGPNGVADMVLVDRCKPGEKMSADVITRRDTELQSEYRSLLRKALQALGLNM